MDEQAQRFGCPNCKSPDNLVEDVEVQGWRAIDAYKNPSSRGEPCRDVDWGSATRTGLVGCTACAWEGRREDLERLPPVGWDGEPLPEVHDEQQSLEVAS